MKNNKATYSQKNLVMKHEDSEDDATIVEEPKSKRQKVNDAKKSKEVSQEKKQTS